MKKQTNQKKTEVVPALPWWDKYFSVWFIMTLFVGTVAFLEYWAIFYMLFFEQTNVSAGQLWMVIAEVIIFLICLALWRKEKWSKE